MRCVLSVITLLFLSSFNGYAKPACDRQCLAGFVTKYVNAMVVHRPKSLPVASKVKFTEDCKEIKLGEGEWQKISGLTDYRRDILDVRQGVAVSFLVIKEGDSPVLYVVRLKIEKKKITEIESIGLLESNLISLVDLSRF